MTDSLVTMDTIRDLSLSDVLSQVARSHVAMQVVLDDGETIEIRRLDILKPNPGRSGEVAAVLENPASGGERSWDEHLLAMAADPDIQAEIRKINDEFAVTEMDGMGP